MATESVDNLDKLIGDIFDYMIARVEIRRPPDSGAIFPIYGKEVFDHTKAALQAYITRECARKVLEELTELHARWSANQTHGDGNKSFTMFISERLAELRAAIEEVGDGDGKSS